MHQEEKSDNGSLPRNCEECGGSLSPEKMKLEEFEGGKLFVMNDVPVLSCNSCGEIWVPETIIKELEQMIALTKKRKLVRLQKVKKASGKKRVKKKKS